MAIPDWVLDPFTNVSTLGSSQFKKQLTELTTNEKLKIKFNNGYQKFWLQKSIPQHNLLSLLTMSNFRMCSK